MLLIVLHLVSFLQSHPGGDGYGWPNWPERKCGKSRVSLPPGFMASPHSCTPCQARGICHGPTLTGVRRGHRAEPQAAGGAGPVELVLGLWSELIPFEARRAAWCEGMSFLTVHEPTEGPRGPSVLWRSGVVWEASAQRVSQSVLLSWALLATVWAAFAETREHALHRAPRGQRSAWSGPPAAAGPPFVPVWASLLPLARERERV